MSDEPVGIDAEFESFLGDLSSDPTVPFSVPTPVDVPPGTMWEAIGEPEPVTEPEVSEDEPITIGDGQCAICGTPVYRPRGKTSTGRPRRVPKYCDIHNPKARTNRDAILGSTGDLEAQLRKIQNDLADDIALLGALTGPFFPVTGYYIVDNADAFTTALLQLCKNNPRALKAAHRLGQVAPVYRCARFGAGVGVAVQVDQKKQDPYSSTSRNLGVDKAYDAVYNQSNNNTDTDMYNNSNNNGPPRYATLQ
jgi:hypothetical protein